MSNLLHRLKQSSERKRKQDARKKNKEQDTWWIEGVDKTIRITPQKSVLWPVRWKLVMGAINLFWVAVIVLLLVYFYQEKYPRSSQDQSPEPYVANHIVNQEQQNLPSAWMSPSSEQNTMQNNGTERDHVVQAHGNRVDANGIQEKKIRTKASTNENKTGKDSMGQSMAGEGNIESTNNTVSTTSKHIIRTQPARSVEMNQDVPDAAIRRQKSSRQTSINTSMEGFTEERVPVVQIVNNELAMVELQDDVTDEKEQIVVHGNKIILHRDLQQKSFAETAEQKQDIKSKVASSSPVIGSLISNLRQNTASTATLATSTTSNVVDVAQPAASVQQEKQKQATPTLPKQEIAQRNPAEQKQLKPLQQKQSEQNSLLAALDTKQRWKKLPLFEELPPEIQADLPDVYFSAHLYVPDRPEVSSVIINQVALTAGSRIADQFYLQQITPRGAVLEFRGRRFYVNLLD